MYEDDPQEKVFDVLGQAVFNEDPLGRAVIGRAPVIAETPVAEIANYHRSRYVAGNVVIAAAGAVEHEKFLELVASLTDGIQATSAPAAPAAPAASEPQKRFERKDTEQYHVCLGGRGLSRHDERRFALRVLDTIFGGTSSSRLFQKVREQLGLAYAVYSFTGAYQDTGQIGLYLGTRPENLRQALSVAGDDRRVDQSEGE